MVPVRLIQSRSRVKAHLRIVQRVRCRPLPNASEENLSEKRRHKHRKMRDCLFEKNPLIFTKAVLHVAFEFKNEKIV